MSLDLVRTLGVLVAEVPGLTVDSRYYAKDGILLLNAALDDAQREEVGELLLQRDSTWQELTA